MIDAVFAIPGDHTQRTGGYIYEATVLKQLNHIGCETELLSLPASFPNPTPDDMDTTLAALSRVPAHVPIILDGFLVGSLDPSRAQGIQAPLIGIVHHPLGLETGLAADRAEFLRQNEREMLTHMAHVMVPSPHTAEVLTTQFAVPEDKTTIALPGFARPLAPQDPQDPPLILSVGLLAPRKGHDVLLRALSEILDLDWRAEIVGKTHDPSYAASLQALQHDLNLTNRVSFSGELDGTALATRFQSASLFALASRYEGYGMVLSEAIMHGLPVVSCHAGGIPDTVGSAGLLSDPDDWQCFSANLRRILTEPQTYASLQSAAKTQALSLPSWSDTAQLFARTIRTLQSTTQ
ncbi:MAG: glycosyltransferase family 4 protein [Pseudomonadota bacterium]